MSSIVPFQFDAQEIRVHLDDEGNPWWIAKDVCLVLGLTNVSKTVSRLKQDEKGVTPIATPGGIQSLIIINEAGLYRLIFRSDKPDALRFQDWVFTEVLPTIRQTGHYRAARPLTFDYLRDHRAFLEDLGLFEDRDRLLLADIARTQLQRQAGLLPAPATALASPQGFDMEDALRILAPHLTASQLRKLTGEAGKRVAAEYRKRFNQDPESTTRFIDGKARSVKWYRSEHTEWAYPILQAYLAQHSLLNHTP